MIDLCKNCGNHNLAHHAPILNPSEIWFECYKNVKLVEKESSITGRINYEKSGEPESCRIIRGNKNKCPHFTEKMNPYLEHVENESFKEFKPFLLIFSIFVGIVMFVTFLVF